MPRGVGLTRARVLALAADLVDAEGPDALTLTRLAELVGVRKPSLYKHVDGLPDVLAGLTLRAYAGMAGAIGGLAASSDAHADLRALAGAWRSAAKGSPGLYALTLRTHLRGDDRVRAAGDALVDEILGRLRRVGIAEADVVHAARAFRAFVHGFVVLEAADGFGLDVAADASFDAGLDALVRGFGARRKAG